MYYLQSLSFNLQPLPYICLLVNEKKTVTENNYEIKGLTRQLLFLKLFITINDAECFRLAQQVGQ